MPPNRGQANSGGGDDWLIKQGELLLGPVPTEKLTELIQIGELDAETLVASHGPDGAGEFRKLGELDAFRLTLAKAQARERVQAHTEEIRIQERKGRLFKLLGVGIFGLGLLLGGGRLAWWLALNRPWETQIHLPQPVIADDDELPVIKLASSRQAEEFAYPVEGASEGTQPPSQRPRQGAVPTAPATPLPPPALAEARPKGKAPVKAAPGAPAALVNRKPLTDDDVNVVQQWDQNAINGVIRERKKSLHPCLSAEAERQKAGWSARIPIEFTIGNDGRITKLWIDNPAYKSDDTDLHRCMLGALRKWQFPRYEGEQANVSLAFNVGAR